MQTQPNRVNTASPYPTPSSSPGAMSLPPESEWSSTGSEWSMGASAHSSRAPSPSRPASRCPTPSSLTPEQLQYFGTIFLNELAEGRIAPLSTSPHPMPVEASTSRPATPKRIARVPRPANAFMLYRSHLIKTNQIPKDIEPRQQNISRVAGECWNLLSEEEKAHWHAEAAKTMAEHRAKNPGYKFSPERKGSRRKDPSDGEAPQKDSQAYIRYIREKYVKISGEAVPPPRPRKTRSRRNANSQVAAASNYPFAPSPLVLPSPPPLPDVARVSSAPPTVPVPPAMHPPPFVPAPSSGAGYSFLGNPSYSEYFSHCLTQAAQEANQDNNATAKTSTYNDSALPTQPKFTFPSIQPNPTPESAPEADLGLRSSYVAGSPPQGDASRPQTPSKWESLESFLNVPDLLGPSGTPLSDVLSHEDPNVAYSIDAPLQAEIMDKWF